jgi:hypothetical protein
MLWAVRPVDGSVAPISLGCGAIDRRRLNELLSIGFLAWGDVVTLQSRPSRIGGEAETVENVKELFGVVRGWTSQPRSVFKAVFRPFPESFSLLPGVSFSAN